EEDKNKMIREVVNLQIERPKVIAPPPVTTDTQAGGKKGKKKKVEEPVVADTPPDTGSTMIPAPASEIAKRATGWNTAKNKKFAKNNATSAGDKVTCNVVFPYKPKELNPVNDVEGEISMDVTIECKEGKYRFTINNMKHKAKSDATGGDVFNETPECGTMKISSQTWKQIRSAALVDGNYVAEDLKAKMSVPLDNKSKDDW
ncbi:MAG TPA: hypothetical protein VNX68_04130, partial [Nitrosopumilaceae archaeon]|nr:hypothetical protein [Nitrosopumilaceae archaeon]